MIGWEVWKQGVEKCLQCVALMSTLGGEICLVLV